MSFGIMFKHGVNIKVSLINVTLDNIDQFSGPTQIGKL